MLEFRLKFHRILFLGVQSTIFQHWFRKWLGADQVTSHYLNQLWLDSRRIYASFGLNELTINQQWFRQWLVACSAPSHYPNQCWPSSPMHICGTWGDELMQVMIVFPFWHYNDAIMSSLASEVTSLTIVYSTVYSGADQRKHRSSTSLAFVRGIHRGPVNSLHKWPVTRKMFRFYDVIMI